MEVDEPGNRLRGVRVDVGKVTYTVLDSPLARSTPTLDVEDFMSVLDCDADLEGACSEGVTFLARPLASVYVSCSK